MKVVVLDVCKKEMANFPEEILGDFVDAVALLNEGVILNMPLSKAMPSLGKNVHELRLKDRNGIYRVIYVLKRRTPFMLFMLFKRKPKRPLRKISTLLKNV